MQIKEFIAGLLEDKALPAAAAPHYHIGAIEKRNYEQSQQMIAQLDKENLVKLLAIANKMAAAAQADLENENHGAEMTKIIRDALIFWKEIKDEIAFVYTERLMQKILECAKFGTEIYVPCGICRMTCNSYLSSFDMEGLHFFAAQARTARTRAYSALRLKFNANGMNLEVCQEEKLLWQDLNFIWRITQARME